MFGGVQLQDRLTLRDYNIQKGSTISVIFRLRPGEQPPGGDVISGNWKLVSDREHAKYMEILQQTPLTEC